MGKISKSQSLANKEAFLRMNFLYQAANLQVAVEPNKPQLSRFYIRTMRTISKKLVLRMDPSMKRTFCKVCNTLLISGVTATLRQRSKREKHTVLTCLSCGTVKRFHKWKCPKDSDKYSSSSSKHSQQN